MTATPDRATTERFLSWLGHEMAVIYSIPREGGAPLSMGVGDEFDTQHFLDFCVRDQLNAYVSAAITTRVDTKSKKEHIIGTRHLWCDIDFQDPSPAEQARVLGLLTSNLPSDVPEPSLVVMSGGGVQGWWELEEIATDQEAIEAANRWLAGKLGGDHCWSVEHIMRLPGSVNLPDAKKRDRGRVEATATILDLRPEVKHRLSAFGTKERGAGVPEYDSRGVAPSTLTDLSALDEYDVYPRVMQLILDGQDKAKHPSRSEAVLDVTCNLCRCGVPDHLILGILTNPTWKISESVLNHKGRAPLAQARRELERARGIVALDPPKPKPELDDEDDCDGRPGVAGEDSPPAEDDESEDDTVPPTDYRGALRWTNSHYFSLLLGGSPMYCREERDGTITKMTKEGIMHDMRAFKVEFEGKEGETDKEPLFKIWDSSEKRRYYRRGFTLQPPSNRFTSGVDLKGYYNLWRGFAIKPRAGSWAKMRQHVLEVLAGGDTALDEYIVKWAAWTLQNPADPAKVALVFRGDEGSGKGVFCNALVDIFGVNRHGLRIQNMMHLEGRFNAHLRHTCLLFCDEAAPSSNALEGSVKGALTEPHIPIEAKGRDMEMGKNHLHVVLSSNRGWVVNAGPTSRRWVVCDVSGVRSGDREYFRELFNERRDGGDAAMAHDLLTMDIRGWHPEINKPATRALEVQRALSLTGFNRMWHDMLDTGGMPGATDRAITVKELIEWCQHTMDRRELQDVNQKTVGDMLRRCGFVKGNGRKEGQRCWKFPPLEIARKRFNEKFHWDDSINDWDLPELAGDEHPDMERAF